MKKILVGLIAVLLIIGGAGYTWYKTSYGGSNYYVKIHNDGKKLTEKADGGNVWHGYGYNEDGYAKDGKKKKLEFTSTHNLRHDAFLKLTYNNEKGVTSWEEVKESEVPQNALNQLSN